MAGKPVGVSFSDGRGTSGILCGTENDEVYILEYLYHDQFALKHYNYRMIQDIHLFPPCRGNHNRQPVVY